MTQIFHILLNMLNEMSPYILLGFLIAGLLNEFVPQRLMSRHLSGSGFGSVLKAALVGVPLPLCSCGVLPTAVAMRRAGASRAASTSFLIATPQTGVDSIAATYSLLGPAFAVIRPVAAFATSLVGGVLVGKAENEKEEPQCHDCAPADTDQPKKEPWTHRIGHALKYGFYDMVQSIGGWLVIGLIIAALITLFVPDDFFLAARQYPLISMLAVVAIAVPMYVCATGSIPIALSLMIKGLSPGAAFVLLMAGPAANFASITVVSRAMGKKCASVYIATIVASAILIGLAIDYLMPAAWFALSSSFVGDCCHVATDWFATGCTIVLLTLLAVTLGPGLIHGKLHHHYHEHLETNQNPENMKATYIVKGMQCPHCRASVEKGLAEIPGVTSVKVDLATKTAVVEGDYDPAAIRTTIEKLGFDLG